MVKFPAESTLPKVPGQRRFTYTASPRGLVDISETGLFEGVASEDCIRARYHDGTAIPNHHDPKLYDSAIALRHVDTEPFNRKNGKGKDHVWLYVLGTAAEAEAVHRSLWQADKPFDSVAFQRIVVSR